MAYSITTYSGTKVATVQDATINTTSTAITLIGRDYAGYGAFLNENFVYLLENFAGNTAPAQKITGQIWYDTTINTLKVWNNGLNTWKPISSSIVQNSAPVGAISTTGDLWFNTDTNQLYAYNGGWQLIGPGSSGGTGSTSGAIVENVIDTSAQSHVVIKFYVSNTVVGIVSKDAAFTPQTSISGFTTINPGFNLVSSTAVTNSKFTGSATNALLLNGVASNKFIRNDFDDSTPFTLTVGNLKVGSSATLSQNFANNEVALSSISNGFNVNFYSTVSGVKTRTVNIDGATGQVTMDRSAKVGQNLQVLGQFTANGTTTLADVVIVKNKILPYVNNSLDVGSAVTVFANVYASRFVGSVTGNVLASTVTVPNVSISDSSITINGNAVITAAYVAAYVQTAGRNSQGVKTVSTVGPSGGSDGDIWYQV